MRPVAFTKTASKGWLLLSLGAFSFTQAAHSDEWPYNLPADAKYWPEEALHRPTGARSFQARSLEDSPPPAIRMMGMDEGEKFLPEYWQYTIAEQAGLVHDAALKTSSAQPSNALRPRDVRTSEDWPGVNASISFNPPFKLHTDDQTTLNPHFKSGTGSYAAFFRRSPKEALAVLEKRVFQCPTNTFDCSSIGRPNSCCAQGEVCNIITDTGLGDVACCPANAQCSGDLLNCDLGFTKCSDNLGGGCCIPQYVCIDIGCGPGPSLISLVTTSPTASKISNPPPPPPPPSTSTSSPSTNTGPQSTLACSSGFKACPASQGGGCCQTDRECGATNCPLPSGASSSSSTTQAFNAPARPTDSTVLSSTYTGTVCPTGFYQCDAFLHNGGCCRVGRDCGLTSCPATDSITVVNSQGVTIVQPSGNGVTSAGAVASTSASISSGGAAAAASASTSSTAKKSCPSGWLECPSAAGCCPQNYDCAANSRCTVKASASLSSSPGEPQQTLPSAVNQLPVSKGAVVSWSSSSSSAALVAGVLSVGLAMLLL